MPTRVRSEAFTKRPPIQTCGSGVQSSAPDTHRAREGQEPLAQRGLTLWCPATGTYYILLCNILKVAYLGKRESNMTATYNGYCLQFST